MDGTCFSQECAPGQSLAADGGECSEPGFDTNQALIDNSGLEGITSICDTFETVPLREELCDGTCLKTNDQIRSWDLRKTECNTCRDMCLNHFLVEDNVANGGSLTRICSACIEYYEADVDDPLFGMYNPLGPLHYHTSRPGTALCEEYKARCSQLHCDSCIDTGPAPLVFNGPVAINFDSVPCFAKLPICDDYLYTQRQLTCARTTLPEIGGCEPRSIGEGTCNAGCNTEACEWDRGDCCAENLAQRHMPTCAATWNSTILSWDGSIGDGNCHMECWNEYCLQDGDDCRFCSETCFRPAASSSVGCNACREDCRSEACDAVCPDHTACTGECSACSMERTCITDDVMLGGLTALANVPASRVTLVQSLPQCMPQNVGNGVCDFECFTSSCSFDDGDCGTCPPECVLRQGDGICDAECCECHDWEHPLLPCLPALLAFTQLLSSLIRSLVHRHAQTTPARVRSKIAPIARMVAHRLR